MKLDEYHRYAAFLDAATALPTDHYQLVRLTGNAAGEAFRAWCAAHFLDVTEVENVRVEDGRRIAWTTLESPQVSVGVYLDDDRCLDPELLPPVEPAPAPTVEQPPDEEVAF